MKIKHLLIVSLILAVLTIGAVSASEDISDNLSVNNIADDSISESSDVDEIGDWGYDEEPSLYIVDTLNTNTNDGEYDRNIASVEEYYGDYLNGTVSLYIDNAKYYSKPITPSDKIYEHYIYVTDLNLPNNLKTGNHLVKLTYLKGNTTYSNNRTVKFEYAPNLDYISDHSVGETIYININHMSGATGTATLYNYNESSDKIGSVVATGTISNGVGKLSVAGLAKGNYDYYLNMTINGQQYDSYIYGINVKDNTAGYTSTASSQITVGSNAVVTFSGSKTKGYVSIYVDNNWVKDIYYAGGTLSETITGLSVGSHQITVQYHKDNDFYYSKTSNVNVVKKPTPQVISLALKKVTVKKSAKKLVLTAILKINKKAVKGKKITFKFNGKTYKAKTNKKGVAKVTIKKNILKKLKVGKKVTYTAKYSTKTVKKSVKVKK